MVCCSRALTPSADRSRKYWVPRVITLGAARRSRPWRTRRGSRSRRKSRPTAGRRAPSPHASARRRRPWPPAAPRMPSQARSRRRLGQTPRQRTGSSLSPGMTEPRYSESAHSSVGGQPFACLADARRHNDTSGCDRSRCRPATLSYRTAGLRASSVTFAITQGDAADRLRRPGGVMHGFRAPAGRRASRVRGAAGRAARRGACGSGRRRRGWRPRSRRQRRARARSGGRGRRPPPRRSGPPIGVLPVNVTDHRAITRPRNWGSAVSCSVVLPVAMNAVLNKPVTASAASSPGSDGTSAAARMAIPKPAPAMVNGSSPVRARPATTSPPATAPIAHGGGEEPVGPGAAVQADAGQQRQGDLELVGQRADQGHHQQRHQQARRAADIPQALRAAGRVPARPAAPGAAPQPG